MNTARIKVTPRELKYLKGLTSEELLTHTAIPPIRLDHIEEDETSIEVVDCGNTLGSGELVDNSVLFTIENFEPNESDIVMHDILDNISLPTE